MFFYCDKLSALNMSNWDVSNVGNMCNMFAAAGNLTTLDVSNWNVGNVTNVVNMFRQCNKLTNSSVKSIANMLCAVNISKIPSTQRNLYNNNSRSPFYTTKFSNIYYTEYLPALRAAGWTC